METILTMIAGASIFACGCCAGLIIGKKERHEEPKQPELTPEEMEAQERQKRLAAQWAAMMEYKG